MQNYNDQEAAEEYFWRNFYFYCTHFESLAIRAIEGEIPPHALLKSAQNEDDEVIRAVENNDASIRSIVKRRIIRDHGQEILFLRCPVCQRIVASPRARQCLWCGHDWHPGA